MKQIDSDAVLKLYYNAEKFTISQYVNKKSETPKKTSSLLVAHHHWIFASCEFAKVRARS